MEKSMVHRNMESGQEIWQVAGNNMTLNENRGHYGFIKFIG